MPEKPSHILLPYAVKYRIPVLKKSEQASRKRPSNIAPLIGLRFLLHSSKFSDVALQNEDGLSLIVEGEGSLQIFLIVAIKWESILECLSKITKIQSSMVHAELISRT